MNEYSDTARSAGLRKVVTLKNLSYDQKPY